MSDTIRWNKNVKLIISDVDETVADVYTSASSELVRELEKLLVEGRVLFLISGHDMHGIQKRIVSHIKKHLRKSIVVGHCSGAEVWGFNEDGTLQSRPLYSLYGKLSSVQKKQWRDVIHRLLREFKLVRYPVMSILEFEKKTGGNPLAIMVDDRGPQITFEVVNGYDLSIRNVRKLKIRVPRTHGHYDLRIPILEKAEKLFEKMNLSISPRLAGVFALDFVLEGISKTTAVKYIIEHKSILDFLDLRKTDVKNPKYVEVWGDKFSVIRGGTDRHISEALPKNVRSITFREEDPREFPPGYNIVVWNGTRHLHEGLLEFLKSRPQAGRIN